MTLAVRKTCQRDLAGCWQKLLNREVTTVQLRFCSAGKFRLGIAVQL